jgi:hypothetical protein
MTPDLSSIRSLLEQAALTDQERQGVASLLARLDAADRLLLRCEEALYFAKPVTRQEVHPAYRDKIAFDDKARESLLSDLRAFRA